MTYRKIFNFLMLFATFSLCSGHSAVMFAEQDNSGLPVVQESTAQMDESGDKPSDKPMLDESANPVQQRDPLIAVLSEKNIPAVYCSEACEYQAEWNLDKVLQHDGWRGLLERLEQLYSEPLAARLVELQKFLNTRDPGSEEWRKFVAKLSFDKGLCPLMEWQQECLKDSTNLEYYFIPHNFKDVIKSDGYCEHKIGNLLRVIIESFAVAHLAVKSKEEKVMLNEGLKASMQIMMERLYDVGALSAGSVTTKDSDTRSDRIQNFINNFDRSFKGFIAAYPVIDTDQDKNIAIKGICAGALSFVRQAHDSGKDYGTFSKSFFDGDTLCRKVIEGFAIAQLRVTDPEHRKDVCKGQYAATKLMAWKAYEDGKESTK